MQWLLRLVVSAAATAAVVVAVVLVVLVVWCRLYDVGCRWQLVGGGC